MKVAAALAGTALLAVIWLVPLQTWLGPFPAHMLRHMGLVAVAAPLLVLGLPRLAGLLAGPVLLASALEFAVVWAWHLPGLHAAAYRSGGGFALEQGSFLLAGLLVWASALRPGHALAGAGGLLLTSMHMTLLGALLVLAPRDLYAAACGLPPDLTGQQAGGLVMLGIGTPVYLVAGLALVRGALSGPAGGETQA